MRVIFRTLSMTETPWDRTVAMATPATPMRSTATKRMSSTMFIMLAVNRNRNGLRESPTERSTPAEML